MSKNSRRRRRSPDELSLFTPATPAETAVPAGSNYVPPRFDVTDNLDGKRMLRKTLKRELPEFVKMVADSPVDTIVLHQDAFASGYDVKEYILFGMAMKYAGLCGKEVHIIGKPGATG